MSELLQQTLEQLRVLVSHDTRNPPREIDGDGIFAHARAQLPDFDIHMSDHGAGAVSLLAVRGRPRYLFNVHLDTVPAAPAWSRDPFDLQVDDERVTGLGACDIKGAAAALLAVARATDEPMALLFTSDEEANDTRCVKAFLDAFLPLPSGEGRGEGAVSGADSEASEPSPQPLSRGERGFKAVIVAEPTQGRAVLAHRGIQSVKLAFTGRAGHASQAQEPGDSALHQAMHWGHAALEHVAAQAQAEFDGLSGLRFNIGRVEGGIKANVIAPDVDVRFQMRPLPSMDGDDLLATFRSLAPVAPAEFTETFRGPSLPAGGPEHAEANRQAAEKLASALGIPLGPAVDFWTEAALFSAGGYTTFVYGPGDIAQAHAADEWVALAQLREYADTIHSIVAGGKA